MDTSALLLSQNNDWIEKIISIFNQLGIHHEVTTENLGNKLFNEHVIIDGSFISPEAFSGAPNVHTLTVLVENENFDEARKWMNVGADAIFIFPSEIDRFHEWLKEMDEQIKNRKDFMGNDEHGNEVWAFYSAKGGSGKSTISAIVAQSLAIHEDKRVLLIDMNSQYGGQEPLFGLESGRSYEQLQIVLDELTPEHIMNVSNQTVTGVNVLLGPSNPMKSADLPEYLLPKVIKVAKTYFDYVLLDLPTELSDRSYAGLSEATRVFYVLNGDSLSIRAFKQARSLFDRLALKNGDNFNVILNRDSSKSELQEKDVEKIIDEPIFTKISADFSGLQPMINMGYPFFEKKKDKGNNKVSRDVRKLVLQVMEGDNHVVGT
ncbi:AAA family ATPase [Lentibacillus cibarius]|uniref:AAA family ATPase n=1 Tax=Lentibacillus cibarius TaxID=2583219 RepID=A0A549YJK3_9BACI|nr:AAA family ATPase [Lentibacillus cibarius]TMN23276.1 hypothetical protein FFL34_15155 [Lentibacillus cibarius]TRM12063.1 AAA family ATPase [Lentibacillus cibarius]